MPSIGPDELAYLGVVRAQAQEAAGCERRAAELEAQAQALRQRAVALYGAHESYVGHLCEKYGLDQRTDAIDPESGEITRAPVLELGELREALVTTGPPVDGPSTNGVARP